MNLEYFRTYCLSKKGVTESFPFDESTLVFKVMSKMFVGIGLERDPLAANLKCDPEKAIELREMHPEDITAGYHMSKKHWNTILLESELNDKLIKQLIDHSYDLVVKGLKKVENEALKEL